MFYSADETEDLSPGHSMADNSEIAPKRQGAEPGYPGVFATKTR